MGLLIVFLVAMTFIGAGRRTAWVRDHPLVLLAFCTLVSVGFYSYRIVL